MYNQVNRILYSGAMIMLFSTSIFIEWQSKLDKRAAEAKKTEYQEDHIVANLAQSKFEIKQESDEVEKALQELHNK